jgi:signal recognition particle subunit SRP19
VVQTGIALSSIKRDLENEKEQKKKALTGGAGQEEGGAGGQGGKEKQPKMKRVMVRGKR